MTVDLTTSYLGMELSSPIVPSASPATGHPDSLLQLAESGVGAVVLPSLFEEEIEGADIAVHDHLEASAHPEATRGYAAEPPAQRTGPRHTLDLLRYAKDSLDIPVIASLNGSTAGGWVRYAEKLVDAGADALELNIYRIAADVDSSSQEVEDSYVRLVEHVRSAVSVPLAVKVGPYFTAMAHMAHRLSDAGVDGLVLFNRFYQPDIDLERLEVTPDLVLSTRAELRLVLRWMAILRGRVEADLAATSGVHAVEDVVKLLLAGADVVMMASSLLANGPGHAGFVLNGVREWFTSQGYESLDHARGAMSQASVPDPSAYERANYVQTIHAYSSRYH
ncbi:MAG: dihydroorotate dehydrogenase-like protein [Actinomycetota bacterium]